MMVMIAMPLTTTPTKVVAAAVVAEVLSVFSATFRMRHRPSNNYHHKILMIGEW
jgi:hypothetical protein